MPLYLSILVFLISAALLTCIILLIISIRKPGAPSGKPPAWRGTVLLDEDERALYNDLSGVCQKLELHLYTKMSLGNVLDMSTPKNLAWQERMRPLPVDFVIAGAETGKPALVLFREKENPGPQRAEVIAALEAAGIPHMILRNYNLPGLEKAVREKTGGARRGRTRGDREKYEAEQIDHAQAQ